jgi:tetratricopeptide (TPR) repeat protein
LEGTTSTVFDAVRWARGPDFSLDSANGPVSMATLAAPFPPQPRHLCRTVTSTCVDVVPVADDDHENSCRPRGSVYAMAPPASRVAWDWWRAAIGEGAATLLVGAGVSAAPPSRLPLAAELVELLVTNVALSLHLGTALTRRIVQSLRGVRLEVVADILVEHLGPRVLRPLERALEGRPVNAWHRFLATAIGLGCHVVTTNFDTLIEQACDELGVPYRLVGSASQARRVSSHVSAGPGVVLKIHGTLVGTDGGRGTSRLAVALRHVGRGLPLAMAGLFRGLIGARPLVIVGYSGRDDFDIAPLLHSTDRGAPALWVLHDGARRSVEPLRGAERRWLPAGPAIACARCWRCPTEVLRGDSSFVRELLRPRTRHAGRARSTPPRRPRAGGVGQSDATPALRASASRRASSLVHLLLATRSFTAALSVIEQAEAAPRLLPAARITLLLDRATVLEQQGQDLRAASGVAAAAVKLANASGSPLTRAEALDRAGVIARRRGRYHQADRYYREALGWASRAGRAPGLIARIQAHRAVVLGYLDRLVPALSAFERTLAYERATGDLRGVAMSLNNVGMTLSDMGRFPEALDYLNRSIALKEELGDLRGIAQSLHNRGKLHWRKGELPEAAADFTESLGLRRSHGRDQHGVAQSLLALGRIAMAQGNLPGARRLAAESLAAMVAIGDARGQSYARDLLAEIPEP